MMKHIRQNILDELATNPGRSVVDIAKVVELSVTATHDILQQMIDAGDVVTHERTSYYLAPKNQKSSHFC